MRTTEPSQPAVEPELYCPRCAYDLRALAGDVCPECGLRVDRATLHVSRLPWAHRRTRGRLSAYASTLWLAMFRPSRLADELARPVRLGDAQRFRVVTLVVPGALLAGVIVLALLRERHSILQLPDDAFDLWQSTEVAWRDGPMIWSVGAAAWPVLPICAVLMLVLLSGVHSYWFHPRTIPVVRQNRAVALSYYAAAPLAPVMIPLLVGAGMLLLLEQRSYRLGADLNRLLRIVMIGSWVVAGALPLLTWVNLLRLLHRATRGDAVRTFVAAVTIPLAWVAVMGLSLGVLPAVVGFVWLVIDSLL